MRATHKKDNTLPESPNLPAALAYAKRGWHVAPVNVNYLPSGKKKVEFLVPWGSNATDDQHIIESWWTDRPYAGIAIATKPSGLVVVDLDESEGVGGLNEWLMLCAAHGPDELPETYAVTTPSGGLHLYFRDPENRATNSASKLAPGVDIRGGGSSAGGVVFVPPTSTGRGSYETVNPEADIADCPEWLWALIEKPRSSAGQPRTVPDSGGSLLDEETFETVPAGHDETIARVKVLAEQIAALDGPGGNQEAARIAFMAGQYVGAGQIHVSEAIAILVTPLLAWEASTGQESTWHTTIHNQVREGAKSPRAWGSAKKDDEPVPKRKPVSPEFTDASLADYLADELFHGKLVRTKGLGWLEWTGTHWRACDDGVPVEVVRKYVKKRLITEIRKNRADSYEAKAWARYNASGKIHALVTLIGNIAGILRRVEEFDQHSDLVNTPAGVLDLLSLEITDHDPGLLLTKITRGSYRPAVATKAFASALECVPEDALEWLQRHFGAGVSGRPKPRVPAVLLTGGGRNGKTMLCEAALEALGGITGDGYAVQIPNELLLLGKASGGPSPEKLALRGARFVYIEETPEGRYLDVNALKKIVGTGVMSARDLYKGLVSFRMTHILFINTNYPPRVSETDTATWDRLTSLQFPYRYRKDNDDLGEWLETDRHGSPTLAEELLGQDALDEMFTWMVTGARAGRTDQVAQPASVETAVSAWRKEGDALLRFLEDMFVFDKSAWVTTQSLYGALREWSEKQGQQKPPPMNTFISRVKAHTGLKSAIAVRRVISTTAGLSVPAVLDSVIAGANSREGLGKYSMAAFGVRYRTESD